MMTKSTINRLGIGISAALILSSCDSKDPAMEEETMKLKQQNQSLAEKLKAAESQAQSSSNNNESELTETRAALEEAQNALKELEARFDRKRLEASFAAAVSDFKQQTLQKYPGNVISQMTMHEMVMPSDHPFSSGLTMMLRNSETSENKMIHVKALGNLDGEWTFQKVTANKLAANRPAQGAPPTQARPPKPVQPARPVQPTRPVIRRIDSGAGASAPAGRVHRIDWGD